MPEIAQNADISIFYHLFHQNSAFTRNAIKHVANVIFQFCYYLQQANRLQFIVWHQIFQQWTSCTSDWVSKLEQKTDNRWIIDHTKNKKLNFLGFLSKYPTNLCSMAKFWGNWSMHLRITAVSFFYRFLLEALEIPEVPIDKMAIIFVWMTSLPWNLIKMCRI